MKWGFYGRSAELEALEAMLTRGRWFFLKLSGRRRIGKTELVRHALSRRKDARTFYLQVPDSEPAGVVDAACRYMDLFDIDGDRPRTLQDVATTIGRLMREGCIVALDEFQYFHHPRIAAFSSFLQAEVDALRHERSSSGGLIVLGSVHTEMTALLEDRSAPLFGRVTDTLELGHLDVASVLTILSDHTEPTPERLLTLWNLFEGVPKFYRDAWERGVLGAPRRELIREMFFASSGPLRTEAAHWLLQELRGRYDLVLRYVAEHPGCTNADITAWAKSTDPGSERQVGGYLKVLDERYRLIERLQPIFARPRSRNGRFYLRDNFLRAWVSALRAPVAATHFRPLDDLLDAASSQLDKGEGTSLERLAAALIQERSRAGIGDFGLSHEVRGWWDRSGTEIDLVLVNEDAKHLRLGTTKRSPARLVTDLRRFDSHVSRFLSGMPRFTGWAVEKLAIAPTLDAEQRSACTAAGYLPRDLNDLTDGLLR